MGKQTIDVMVEAGKASAAPPLGPALGPTGINIGLVVSEINKKTGDMKGMQVPVKVVYDTDDKSFNIVVGTPPTASLIKKEAGVEKGAANPLTDKIADLRIQQIIKIAKIKEGSLLGNNLKHKIKEVIGTCRSMGILVEGLAGDEAMQAVIDGKFDAQIASGKTELTAAELKALDEERKRLQEELEKRRVEFEAKAKSILALFEKEPNKAKKAMVEAGIPKKIIDELIPDEKKKAPAA